MKKTTLILAICTVSIFANGFETNYIKELNLKNMPENVQKIIDGDEKYQLAIKQLTQKEFMAKKEVTYINPYEPNRQINSKTKTDNAPNTHTKGVLSIPNFKEAYINLEDSYKKTKNPLSSYVIVYLIKTAFGKNNKLEDFSKYSKINYENGLCSGYIDYGDSLVKDYSKKADRLKATKVYQEGMKQCKTGLFASILSSKILRLNHD